MSYSQNLKALIRSTNPEDRRKVESVQKRFVEARLLTPGQLFTSATMSNVSVQYKNDEYIGDVLVPIVDVAKVAGTYFKYGKGDRMTFHDDRIGSKGTPNEVSESRTTDTYSCTPRALTNFIGSESLRQQDAPLDEMMDLTESIVDNLMLNKEMRKATLLTTSGNYDAANVVTLSGSSQWNSATGGDPVAAILTAGTSLWMGNAPSDIYGWCGIEVYNVLRSHPAVLDLFKYGGQSVGLATEDMIAKFFGWKGLVVGKARRQTANEGQTPSYSRIWGKNMGVVRVARKPGIRAASFAYDFRVTGDPKTDLWFRPELGMSGGYQARVGFNEGLEVVANDTGYLIAAAIS